MYIRNVLPNRNTMDPAKLFPLEAVLAIIALNPILFAAFREASGGKLAQPES
jgi:hypothetical protein